MATIYIKNLRLRTIIGIEKFERNNRQDIVINAAIEIDADAAADSDDVKDILNYKTLTKKIVKFAEQSDFFLLEKLTDQILKLIMEDPRALAATVEIDKPAALRFADSVSIKVSAKR